MFIYGKDLMVNPLNSCYSASCLRLPIKFMGQFPNVPTAVYLSVHLRVQLTEKTAAAANRSLGCSVQAGGFLCQTTSPSRAFQKKFQFQSRYVCPPSKGQGPSLIR